MGTCVIGCGTFWSGIWLTLLMLAAIPDMVHSPLRIAVFRRSAKGPARGGCEPAPSGFAKCPGQRRLTWPAGELRLRPP